MHCLSLPLTSPDLQSDGSAPRIRGLLGHTRADVVHLQRLPGVDVNGYQRAVAGAPEGGAWPALPARAAAAPAPSTAPRAAAGAAAAAPTPGLKRPRGDVLADVRAYFAQRGNGTLPDLVEYLHLRAVERDHHRAAAKLQFWLAHHHEHDGAYNLDALYDVLRAFADVAEEAQAWLGNLVAVGH